MIHRWRHGVQIVALGLLVGIPIWSLQAESHVLTGWYQGLLFYDLDFISPLEGLESILASREVYGPLIVGMLIPIAIAVLLGRVFCSWICPINLLQEVSDGLTGLFRRGKPRKSRWRLPKGALWFALVGDLVLVLLLATPLFVFWSPPALVGRELMMFVFYRTLALEGAVIVLVLILNLITPRFFCRYLCPLGGLLAFLGGKRRLVMKYEEQACTHCRDCDRHCPMGIEPSRGESESIYCWNCGTCGDTCKDAALGFRFGKKS